MRTIPSKESIQRENNKVLIKNLESCSLCGKRVLGSGQQPSGNLIPRLAIVAQNPPIDPLRRGIGGFLIHAENPKLNRIEKIVHRLVFDNLRLKRDEIYCTQTVKCPTPKNVVPASVVRTCRDNFLATELETINAQVWLAVGRVATNNMNQLLGKWKNSKRKELPSRPNCFTYTVQWGQLGSKKVITAPHPTISGRFVLPGSWEETVAGAIQELWCV